MTKLAISNNKLAPEWYQMLIGDCQAIIIETDYIARWVLIEGYHALGERISQDINKDPDLVTRSRRAFKQIHPHHSKSRTVL